MKIKLTKAVVKDDSKLYGNHRRVDFLAENKKKLLTTIVPDFLMSDNCIILNGMYIEISPFIRTTAISSKQFQLLEIPYTSCDLIVTVLFEIAKTL